MARTERVGSGLLFTGALSRGYGVVGTTPHRTAFAHRVVMAHHNGPSDLCVLHSCDNPACVEISHLRYGTRGDNAADKVERGRHLHGDGHPSARLTGEQVAAIRADERRQVEIATDYGVHQSTVSRIRAGLRR